tara:strand:+ start:439 stop:678 length:240 start_codon:yes stop_codon:yes gene_type:complete
MRNREGEMKVDKKTVHCPNCDSQNLRLINVVQEWVFERQSWEDTDSPEGYVYYCRDCDIENSECVYKSKFYSSQTSEKR